MADFRYIRYSILDIPDYITVKGKKIEPSIDDEWSGEIEYRDEKYSENQTCEIGIDLDYYWSIWMKPDEKGKFTIRLRVNGDDVVTDTFYPDETPVQQMLDRFVETLEEYL